MSFSDFATPIAYVLFVWWFSTGAILYLDGLPRRTYPLTFGITTVVLIVALTGISHTAAVTSVGAAYSSFTCGLLAWGWNEMMFLFGYITGPRRTACPEGCGGWRRFRLATLTILYHELAILGTAVALTALSWDKPNKVGLWTFVILWAMRLSAKFNVFLGARNLSEDFLPEHLEYLKTYFRKRPINLLFPISVTASTMVFTVMTLKIVDPALSRPEAIEVTFLATLTALAVLEHWFLVLPMPAEILWKWGLSSRTSDEDGGYIEIWPPHDGGALETRRGQMPMESTAVSPSSSTVAALGARIGPNAVIQVVRALRELGGPGDLERVFAAADLGRYLQSLPDHMIPEQEVTGLHHALREVLDPQLCERISRRAGQTTAEYLLANRIPKPIAFVLKRLPPALAARTLLGAIGRHAWTFAGSGHFSFEAGTPVRIRIQGSPLCRSIRADAPACAYYTATFEGLFRALVSPTSTVVETACGAMGAQACVFEITW
ncbi:putative photosynthetic complex assembly protein PuhE [Pararhodospirillum photometricum]|nr:putative photosynthetic complex assembly protein PuhE [Pararhodospirillum photometricum]